MTVLTVFRGLCFWYLEIFDYSEGTEGGVLSGFDSYDRGYFGCFDNF